MDDGASEYYKLYPVLKTFQGFYRILNKLNKSETDANGNDNNDNPLSNYKGTSAMGTEACIHYNIHARKIIKAILVLYNYNYYDVQRG